MNCSHCKNPLHRTHHNKQLDMDICLNMDCPKYRQPQGYHKANNTKVFNQVDRSKYIWKTGGKEKTSLGRASLALISGETFTAHIKTFDGHHL
jgi:hypothetical protein